MTTPAPDICNALAIRKAARRVSQFYDQRLAPCGLRTTQFSILMWLNYRGPVTIKELAAGLVMDRTTMGRNLRPLERTGLVAIGADPRDRRSRALHITAEGKAKCALAKPLWIEAQKDFEEAFGSSRARDVRRALAVISTMELSQPYERKLGEICRKNIANSGLHSKGSQLPVKVLSR